jgi:hypothetical protein
MRWNGNFREANCGAALSDTDPSRQRHSQGLPGPLHEHQFSVDA